MRETLGMQEYGNSVIMSCRCRQPAGKAVYGPDTLGRVSLRCGSIPRRRLRGIQYEVQELLLRSECQRPRLRGAYSEVPVGGTEQTDYGVRRQVESKVRAQSAVQNRGVWKEFCQLASSEVPWQEEGTLVHQERISRCPAIPDRWSYGQRGFGVDVESTGADNALFLHLGWVDQGCLQNDVALRCKATQEIRKSWLEWNRGYCVSPKYQRSLVHSSRVLFHNTAEASEARSVYIPSQNPQRLHAPHRRFTGEDIVRLSWRHGRYIRHEWLEDELAPNTIVTSTAVSSTTAAGSIGIAGGLEQFLQVGTIMLAPNGSEYMQITSVFSGGINVSRAFGGSSANSFAAGQSISIITDNALEGADVAEDTSRPRTRVTNYCQIVKKDVIISGTTRAVTMLGGIQDEWTHQVQKKLRETLRDLEKAVILSVLSGNTLGSASAYRTMAGLLSKITTNSSSWGTLTDSALTSSWKLAWNNGGTDVDLMVCGDTIKRVVDTFNGTRTQVIQGSPGEPTFRNLVSVFECTYGSAPVLLSRWMPANKFALISTARVKVVPLQGRSFQFQEVSKTGDSTKGMVLGEYTLEVRNEKGLVKGTVG